MENERESYAPSPMPAEALPAGAPAPAGPLTLPPGRFTVIQTPMIYDTEDKLGPRCKDPDGPPFKDSNKMGYLVCIRHQEHTGRHRAFMGTDAATRIFYEW
jgi:hypothetical protein